MICVSVRVEQVQSSASIRVEQAPSDRPTPRGSPPTTFTHDSLPRTTPTAPGPAPTTTTPMTNYPRSARDDLDFHRPTPASKTKNREEQTEADGERRNCRWWEFEVDVGHSRR